MFKSKNLTPIFESSWLYHVTIDALGSDRENNITKSREIMTPIIDSSKAVQAPQVGVCDG